MSTIFLILTAINNIPQLWYTIFTNMYFIGYIAIVNESLTWLSGRELDWHVRGLSLAQILSVQSVTLFYFFIIIVLFFLERKPTELSCGFVSISWASCFTSVINAGNCCMVFRWHMNSQWHHVGSGVVRIDPFRFLVRCRTRRINQALSVLSLSLGFFRCMCWAVN